MTLRRIGISILLFTAGFSLWGQSLSKGDSLMRECRFEAAMWAFLQARDDAGVDRAQYALNMADFCAEPHVVAKKRFSRKDFFLYYPLKPQAWRNGPAGLAYVPSGSKEVFFSAPDKAGSPSIFTSRDQDSLWSAPRLLGEAFVSTGSEVFPMLGADGKTLYFASDGLAGLGGFDIFSSTWDAEAGRWGDPVNMGFPFNSPADDYLMADSAEWRASQRATPPPSAT